MFDFSFDTDYVLKELNLDSLPESDKALIIDGIKKQLEVQVRVRLTGLMDASDHNTFASLADSNPVAAKLWLDQRFPNHKELYEEELSDLIRELKHRGDFLVEYDKNHNGR